ncbi:MAG: hypothetical protein LBN06_10565 [Prevotellaceae bacterium]|nr:hypothetical protein [Prevotellaceae bacterium]
MIRNKRQSGRGRYIACMLLLIGLMMPMMPVIPHHHHSNGLLCMNDDVSNCCCEHSCDHQSHQSHHSHCCCNTGCVATHFYQRIVKQTIQWEHSEPYRYITIFPETPLLTNKLPRIVGNNPFGIYRERLHGTCHTRVAGLRAPPCNLA